MLKPRMPLPCPKPPAAPAVANQPPAQPPPAQARTTAAARPHPGGDAFLFSEGVITDWRRP
ncbi:MAG: hypothetical protein V4857_01280 [Pseudomonadota bacterium]